MRILFASEQRCTRNLFAKYFDSGTDFDEPLVVAEHYCAPRVVARGPRFNIDFMLEFVPWAEMPQHIKSIGSTILPNSIGSDLFLTFEQPSKRVILLHLMAGEAFPIKHYRRYIESIESVLRRVTSYESEAGIASPDLGRLTSSVRGADLAKYCRIRKSAYCRLMVVEGDACFLFFPSLTSPEMRGERLTLLNSGQGRVDCYAEAGHVICFDGWIPSQVINSERKLEAIWQDRQSTSD